MQAGGWFHLESIEKAAGQNVPSGGLMKETLCITPGPEAALTAHMSISPNTVKRNLVEI